MAERTLYLYVQDGEDETRDPGDKIDFAITSGTNVAFGNNTPTSFSADFSASTSSGMYADYSSNVTINWSLEFKLNGSWHNVCDFDRSMRKTSSNWAMSGSFRSDTVSLLKAYPIGEVAIRVRDDDVIIAKSTASGSITITYSEPTYGRCTPPSNPRLSATTTASSATLEWDPGGGGTNNAVTGYTIFYQDSADGSSWPILPNWYTDVTGTKCTVYAPDAEGYYRRFLIHTVGAAGSDWISDPVYSGTLRKVSYPTITQQPTLTLGATSGSSVKLSWNAATVSNQNGATIYYQYFVGPKSTYSDSYHIGTTTSLSVTVSEAQIISKCGTGFGASTSGSTCYFFVRAYWDKGGTTGGFVTPTAKAFTYYPTVNAPTGVKLSSVQGIATTVSWTNVLAGNSSQSQAILLIDGSAVASGITGSSGGYSIPKETWRSYTPGNHTIQIAHEWYGRWAYSSQLTFKYESGLVKYYENATTSRRCEVYMWDTSQNKFVLCIPRYNDNGSWKICGC